MAHSVREKHNPVRDLFDAAAQHHAIRLTCRRCRHQRIFDPHALWYLFETQGLAGLFAGRAAALPLHGLRGAGAGARSGA